MVTSPIQNWDLKTIITVGNIGIFTVSRKLYTNIYITSLGSERTRTRRDERKYGEMPGGKFAHYWFSSLFYYFSALKEFRCSLKERKRERMEGSALLKDKKKELSLQKTLRILVKLCHSVWKRLKKSHFTTLIEP